MQSSVDVREHAERNQWLSPLAVVCYLASLKFLIQLIFSNGYGYFRDELYFLACGEHLDWGYVDHAPLIGLIAKTGRMLFGDSLTGIHVLPSLAGAAKVLLAGLIARELGGKRSAIILASLLTFFSGYLSIDNMLSIVAFEGVFWMACVLCFLRAVNRDPRYWVLFGFFAGAGLMNKHSMLFFGFALFLGILLTGTRSQLAGKWFWIGGAIALLIFLPNVIWEWRHDWATLELLRNVRNTGKNVVLSPLQFIWMQVLEMGPLGAPAWIAGLVHFLFGREGKRFRALGITYLALLALMILMHGKAYYLYAIYPMLYAGGAVWMEGLVENVKRLRPLKFAYPALLVIGALATAPFLLPILPIETFLRYQKAIGIEPGKTEVSFDSPLPQVYADRLGWPNVVEKTAEVYYRLSPEERRKTTIFASNYGQAGAIDFFGPKYGLPKSICPHQSYFLWGPRDCMGEIMIVLGKRRQGLDEAFASVEEAGVVRHPYTMSYENYTIYLCRGLKMPIGTLWPTLKFWN